MAKLKKLLYTILQGKSDANITFSDLMMLMKALGFEERIRGSHHIYIKEGIVEILNLQPRENNAKSYQVKQVRLLILKYKLGDLLV